MSSKRELTPVQKKLLVAAAAVEVTAKMLALRDIHRRSADEIRGSKRLWRLAQIVNFFGPAAYFAFGRVSHPDSR
ncbi:MAG: hypothetical protein JHD02_02485 [Thermoleophilaceae bacterium]|nr:hypothetical protein [Thermoleophilaceae bacterium]